MSAFYFYLLAFEASDNIFNYFLLYSWPMIWIIYGFYHFLVTIMTWIMYFVELIQYELLKINHTWYILSEFEHQHTIISEIIIYCLFFPPGSCCKHSFTYYKCSSCSNGSLILPLVSISQVLMTGKWVNCRLLLSETATWFFFPLIWLILKMNSLIKSNHLARLVFYIASWSNKYVNPPWYDINTNFVPSK